VDKSKGISFDNLDTYKMDNTKKTLLEQLQINGAEIERRKQLLGFSSADEQLLYGCKEMVTEQIDAIVNTFYEHQTAIPEIALLIGDSDTLVRLHAAQRGYVLGLFDGFYDLEYVNNRLRIGMVHKRIGVEPKLYLSAVKSLKETLRLFLDQRLADKSYLLQVLAALDKLLYFDTTLIFDTYIRALLMEVESAKGRVESYAEELEQKVAERTRELKSLSQHDPLTGLFNQRAMNEFLRRQFAFAKRQHKSFSLIYFDVDKFKSINDLQGHLVGDAVLKAIAESVSMVSREIDVPCRIGGDEFCLLLPDSTIETALIACERLIQELKIRQANVTLSIGIAETGPDVFLNPDELLRAADKKMYEAKAQEGFAICY
jgi:diguanylate cyclase